MRVRPPLPTAFPCGRLERLAHHVNVGFRKSDADEGDDRLDAVEADRGVALGPLVDLFSYQLDEDTPRP